MNMVLKKIADINKQRKRGPARSSITRKCRKEGRCRHNIGDAVLINE